MLGLHGIEEVNPQLVKWADKGGLDVEPPQRSDANGEFTFDAMLPDLAANTDLITAHVTAKFIQYPPDRLRVSGAGWPWRPTALFAPTVISAIGVEFLLAPPARLGRQ